MPRPGPRPFECVRRAWHSDRHQPMRGSIIQQIFRLVHGSHKPATKKNREWQEKLPCVVLKAEEIMYSKANSEAEYIDPETLWDRASDAINTIIRRDESTETGELLPPCVEAALNLGCVPVRASRSQRHNNPRSYLSPRTQDSASPGPKHFETGIIEPNTILPFNSERPVNLSHPISESNKYAGTQKNKNIPLATNVGRVYPLYTGTHYQPDPTRLHRQPQAHSNMIIVGRPVFPLMSEPAQKGCLQNLFSQDRNENPSKVIEDSHLRNDNCDLSLRLGMYQEPSSSKADFGSRSFQTGERTADLEPPRNKEFSFFPMERVSHQFPFPANRLNFMGEGSLEQPDYRKRKFPSNQTIEDSRLDLFSNQFPSRMKRHEGI